MPLSYNTSVSHVLQAILACPPFCCGNMAQSCTGKHYGRVSVRETANDFCSPADLFHDSFKTVVGSDLVPMLCWEFHIGKCIFNVIHDRDPVFNKRFDMIFQSIGIEIKKLPPFTPMMNSRMENFIRAIKTECLDKIIFTNEQQLRLAVKEYLEYWNHYRPHAGLDGRMVLPYQQDADGEIQEISFLGGLLHGYRRVKHVA